MSSSTTITEAAAALPRNPWNPECWAGGSNSDNGSAVATGAVLGALGTDTQGSIHIPAACCGVTGLVPTFGLVPRSGCVPPGYSMDHLGRARLPGRAHRLARRHPHRCRQTGPFHRVRRGSLAGLDVGVGAAGAAGARRRARRRRTAVLLGDDHRRYEDVCGQYFEAPVGDA
jgi:hypothetical protein